MHIHLVDIPEIATTLEEFSSPDCNQLNAQRLIADMGSTLGQRIRSQSVAFDYLCPILRAGLPLAVGISRHFPEVAVAPIHAKRLTNAQTIAVERIAAIRDDSTLLLVDTIAATGGTLATLGRLLKEEWEGLRLLAAVGYASPEALGRLEGSGVFDTIWVGRVADGVDAQGYLFPATNGDAGDKMFRGMF
ncbi:uracil phosphoribosyltransferase [Lysobacter fragariae]